MSPPERYRRAIERELERAAIDLGRLLRRKSLTLSTAESCTGGLIGKLLTDAAGSSDYFIGGVIAYSNELKINLLDVSAQTLESFGAVSAECARQMAEGATAKLGCDVAVSVTGIAGPGGGSLDKPVGTVYIGVSVGRKTVAIHNRFEGKRSEIRNKAALAALKAVYEALENL